MSPSFFFCNLPNEMLLKIFELCDVYTLLQLSGVCKQFYQISHDVLTKRSNNLLVTNETSKKFREQCQPPLSSNNSKFMTYYNWKNQICLRKQTYFSATFTKKARLHAKCLKMTRNKVCFYDTNVLYARNRGEDGNINEDLIFEICYSPFSCIAYCNDIIISGHLDTSIRHWRIESRDNNLQQFKKHINVYNNNAFDSHISNIEVTKQHIISSSSKSIKVQKNVLEEDDFAEKGKIIHCEQLVQSISLDPTEKKFAVSAGQLLLIYDINENRQIIDKWIDGNTCSQLLWQDPRTILMLYERNIKKMDTRTYQFVHTWDAPLLKDVQKLYNYFSNNLYQKLNNFSTDNLYTIMTGTDVGTVILWDQRLSKLIQTYCMSINYVPYNPVRSVQFDSTHMYVITQEEGLLEFDFKGADHFVDRTKRKTYFSNFF